jgi:hypothetical protein
MITPVPNREFTQLASEQQITIVLVKQNLGF